MCHQPQLMSFYRLFDIQWHTHRTKHWICKTMMSQAQFIIQLMVYSDVSVMLTTSALFLRWKEEILLYVQYKCISLILCQWPLTRQWLWNLHCCRLVREQVGDGTQRCNINSNDRCFESEGDHSSTLQCRSHPDLEHESRQLYNHTVNVYNTLIAFSHMAVWVFSSKTSAVKSHCNISQRSREKPVEHSSWRLSVNNVWF